MLLYFCDRIYKIFFSVIHYLHALYFLKKALTVNVSHISFKYIILKYFFKNRISIFFNILVCIFKIIIENNKTSKTRSFFFFSGEFLCYKVGPKSGRIDNKQLEKDKIQNKSKIHSHIKYN